MKLFFALFLFCAGLFANTLDSIKQSGTIRIGVREGRPPLSQSKDGKFEGFEISLAEALSKGIFGEKKGDIEFIPVTAGERIPFLVNNKVDLIIGTFIITPERSKHVDFSIPYLSVNFGVLTRKADTISDISQLRDMKILVEGNATAPELYLKKEKFDNLMRCATTKECYEMVKNGQADAYINDNIIVLAYEIMDKAMKVSLKTLGPTEFIGVGVSKGNKELLELINAELIKLSKEGFFERAYSDTFEPFYKKAADKKYFLLDEIYRFL